MGLRFSRRYCRAWSAGGGCRPRFRGPQQRVCLLARRCYRLRLLVVSGALGRAQCHQHRGSERSGLEPNSRSTSATCGPMSMASTPRPGSCSGKPKRTITAWPGSPARPRFMKGVSTSGCLARGTDRREPELSVLHFPRQRGRSGCQHRQAALENLRDFRSAQAGQEEFRGHPALDSLRRRRMEHAHHRSQAARALRRNRQQLHPTRAGSNRRRPGPGSGYRQGSLGGARHS